MKGTGLLLGSLIVVCASALLTTAQSRIPGAGIPEMVAEPIKVITPPLSRTARSATSWTNQPLVQVENISTKPIKYFMIEATLPSASAPFMLAYSQQLGKPATGSAKLLEPGFEGLYHLNSGPTILTYSFAGGFSLGPCLV